MLEDGFLGVVLLNLLKMFLRRLIKNIVPNARRIKCFFCDLSFLFDIYFDSSTKKYLSNIFFCELMSAVFEFLKFQSFSF